MCKLFIYLLKNMLDLRTSEATTTSAKKFFDALLKFSQIPHPETQCVVIKLMQDSQLQQNKIQQ